MNRDRLITKAGVAGLAAGVLVVWAPDACAAQQTAVRVEINATDYPNAKCNDGTQAAYYLRGAGIEGAISGNKWLIFLHGGGSCESDESCAERWYDPDGGSDGIIGYHGNMTTSTGATKNFNGEGILDFDGADAWTDPGSNPFAGFNRIMVPYCSSDKWSGRNTTARQVDYAAYVGTQVTIGGETVTIRNPNNQTPALTSIRFSGRWIAEAVVDLVINGGIQSGKKTRGATDAVTEAPSAAEDEVVISGSSAGGGGVIRNLDQLAGIVHGAAASVKVFGVIDASNAVGAVTDADITGDTDHAAAVFYGATSPEEVDTSCQLANPLDTSHRCFNSLVVLKSFIETPHFVVQTAFDGVIHGGLKQSIADRLSATVPADLAAALAEQYIRNQVSLGARELGGGVANPQHVGWFIPNYTTDKHQLMVDDLWFFNTPRVFSQEHMGNPDLGNDPRLGTDTLSTMGQPRALACFRFKVTGQGSGCVDAGDAKVVNTTYPTNPLSAHYDTATSTLTLPFVRLSNNTYFKNVSVVLNPLGSVVVGDPAVGAFPAVNEYSMGTNVLKLPSVTVGDRIYQQVSVSGPGLRVLGYEEVTPPVVAASPVQARQPALRRR